MSDNGVPSVVIAGAARTPVGVKCGTLRDFSPEVLASLAAEEVFERSGDVREHVDAAIGANVYQFTAPGSQDIYFPRNVALRVGLAAETPALMVQRICGSGLQTMISAYQQILLPAAVDEARMILCFAAENMSRTPQINRAPRSLANFWEFEEDGTVEDTILASLNHELVDTNMMLTADTYGSQMGVTRVEADEFAELSQNRARAANRDSHFNGGTALRGMFAIDTTGQRGEPIRLARDECSRETTSDALAKLPGLTPNGLVSPGNASELGDGAGAILLASRQRAQELGLPSRFEIVSYGVGGVDPTIMGRGPVPAIQQALARAGVEQDAVDLWEINEAFAAQFLGVEREMGLDREKTNVNGGAIAIGHPLAATGIRLIVDLMYEMQRRDAKYGCASACIGGGQGAAVIIRDTEA